MTVRTFHNINSASRIVSHDNLVESQDGNQFTTVPIIIIANLITIGQRRIGLFKISVFTVTQSKIKLQTIQYRKSRIQEIKEDKYAKGLAKNQVCAIFHMPDIWKNVLPKFIKLCMETPCLCLFEGTNMAAGNQQKHLFLSFPTNA